MKVILTDFKFSVFVMAKTCTFLAIFGLILGTSQAAESVTTRSQCHKLFSSPEKVGSQSGGSNVIKSVVGEQHWYEQSASIPAESLDSVYFEMALKLGGRMIVGGSDLSEILLGSGKKVATGEINILVSTANLPPKSADLGKNSNLQPNIKKIFSGNLSGLLTYYDNGYQSFNFTFQVANMTVFGRRFLTPDLVLNVGELNNEIQAYKESSELGLILPSKYPTHMVPLKSDFLVEIEYSAAEGKKARVFFRTAESKRRYESKTLALPNEEQISDDWHKLVDRRTLRYVLGYNLIVATRGRKAGWNLSDRTKKLLATWIKFYNQESHETAQTSFLPEWGDLYWSLQGIQKSDFEEMKKEIVNSK